jgi:hypothetical protein
MFVKWKRGPDSTRTAALVNSVRTPAGPRHKHVCYLGTIWTARGPSCLARARFREEAARRLDAAGIEGADRERVEAALEAAVPLPTEAEWAADLADARRRQGGGEWYDRRHRIALAARYPDAGIALPGDGDGGLGVDVAEIIRAVRRPGDPQPKAAAIRPLRRLLQRPDAAALIAGAWRLAADREPEGPGRRAIVAAAVELTGEPAGEWGEWVEWEHVRLPMRSPARRLPP